MEVSKQDREPTFTFTPKGIFNSHGEFHRDLTDMEKEYFLDHYPNGQSVNTTFATWGKHIHEWKEKLSRQYEFTDTLSEMYKPDPEKPGWYKLPKGNIDPFQGEGSTGSTVAIMVDKVFEYDKTGMEILKRERKMAKVYEVYVVNIPEQEVVYQESVVARDEEQAKMKTLSEALSGGVIVAENIENLQFICVSAGTLREPDNK